MGDDCVSSHAEYSRTLRTGAFSRCKRPRNVSVGVQVLGLRRFRCRTLDLALLIFTRTHRPLDGYQRRLISNKGPWLNAIEFDVTLEMVFGMRATRREDKNYTVYKIR